MHKKKGRDTVNSEIFTRILFSRIALKDLYLRRSNSRVHVMHDLLITVNDRVILPFREGLFSRKFAFREGFIFAKLRSEGFIFAKLRIMRSFAKIKPSRNFPNLQFYHVYLWYKLVYLTGYEHMYTCFFVHLSHNTYGFSVHLSGNITPSFQRHTGDVYHMALDARKPKFGVCKQAMLKKALGRILGVYVAACVILHSS